MTLREEAFEAGCRGDWGFIREEYDNLTIEDLVWINTKWDSVLPYQKSHSLGPMEKMFKIIHRPDLRIVELGSYRGFLGRFIIDRFGSIGEWHGYDINHKAIEETIEHPKLFGHKLSKWFWEVDVSFFDVFVSSHTLEHFNFAQFKRVIEHVSICEYLVLEIPWQANWRGFRGSHVLLTTIEEIESLLSKTHRKLIDCSNSKKWIVSAWRRNGSSTD